jgi:hypothetical protein
VNQAYRVSTRVLGAVTVLLGLVMIVLAITRGGGPATVGVLIGVAFVVLGAVRFRTAAPPSRS